MGVIQGKFLIETRALICVKRDPQRSALYVMNLHRDALDIGGYDVKVSTNEVIDHGKTFEIVVRFSVLAYEFSSDVGYDFEKFKTTMIDDFEGNGYSVLEIKQPCHIDMHG